MGFTAEVGFTILYFVTMVAALLGNTLLIYIVWKKPETRSLTSFLFVNMAVADLLVAIFQLPINFVHLHVSEIPPEVGYFSCRFLYYLANITMTASIFSLVVMAFDRYFAVAHPLRQRIWFRKAKLSIPLIWISSLALMAITPFAFELENGRCYYAEDEMPPLAFWTYLLVISYLLPLAIISVLYLAVARRIWFQEIPGQQESIRDQPQGQIPKKKVLRMLIIIVVVFALCWLPLQVFQMDFAVRNMLKDWHPISIYFCYWFSQSNSGINPWLYIGLNGKMKSAFNKMIRCRQGGSGQRNKASTSTLPHGSAGCTRL
ncbi:RYamide receptor-like [Stylophora pistillata]|uniref:RYamide receptor-like n=1 Tax=Stylophora pistillata TaxID=50429 RepID=UPI000C0424B2|nr:RYamide receptor-like [Stylophora pistillata]